MSALSYFPFSFQSFSQSKIHDALFFFSLQNVATKIRWIPLTFPVWYILIGCLSRSRCTALNSLQGKMGTGTGNWNTGLWRNGRCRVFKVSRKEERHPPKQVRWMKPNPLPWWMCHLAARGASCKNPSTEHLSKEENVWSNPGSTGTAEPHWSPALFLMTRESFRFHWLTECHFWTTVAACYLQHDIT